MRTIATIIFIFVLALSMGVLSVKAQDANTTLPPGFFSGQDIADGAARSFADLESQLKRANELVANRGKVIDEFAAEVKQLQAENAKLLAKPCDCGCDCGKVKAISKPKLMMVWMNGCPGCEQWWAHERPRYLAAGWEVERPDRAEAVYGKRYPYWRICIGDSCEEIAWVPFAQLDGKVQAILDKRKH